MRRKAIVLLATAAIGGVVCAPLVNAAPAPALPSPSSLLGSLGSGACKIIGTVGEGWWGTACNGAVGVAQKVSSIAGKLSSAGKKVAKAAGTVSSNGLVQRAAGLAAIVAWVLGGAKWTMDHMQSVITHTTSPALTAGWFTGVYLKIEAIALLFTLLFLFAAAAEALLRQDSAVLARAVCVYLPLAALGTAIATPVIMILLAATDQLSSGMATIAGQNATHFLTGTTAWVAAGLTAADPFFAAMAGGLVVAAGGALWVEMLIREIAVYVIVAMLPLAFAAMVWPARRVWAIRALEVLIALILSKMLIVAVLALGTAALAHASGALNRLLGGLALVLIGAFTPWVLLRLIPMSEVASAAVGHIRGQLHNTAGMRTPEAALAGKAAERAFGNGNAGMAAGGVGVSEMLEQMLRNAHTAESSAHAPEEPVSATAANGFEPGLNRQRHRDRSGYAARCRHRWTLRPHRQPAPELLIGHQ